jgi:hypothetical protein
LQRFRWSRHGRSRIDVSRTLLRELTVDVEGLREIVLGESIATLNLVGSEFDGLAVVHPRDGGELTLAMSCPKDGVLPVFRLPALSNLRIRAQVLDAAGIADAYPHLTSLTVMGAPGTLRNLAMLAGLARLRHLQLAEMFGYGAAEFPTRTQWPLLESLWLTSFPADCAKIAKNEFGDCRGLSLTQPRSQAWLDDNVDNPFRSWDGRDGIAAKHAKAAAIAYRKASAAIRKLAQPAAEAELTPILEAFIAAMNRIDDKHSIDTIEREEIAEIYFGLLEKAGLASDAQPYGKLFDRLRDF